MTEDLQELRVEATGETVGEAKWQALRQLEALEPGIDRGSVRFQVVAEGERGLLGVGYSPARVFASAVRPSEATAPPRVILTEEQAPATELAAIARALVERITSALQIECHVRVSETDETLLVSCSGADLGLLIGRRGQTIDAVQYVVNAAVFRSRVDWAKEVVVDAAGYRARRRMTLEALAVEGAERAVAGAAPVELEAMSAVERKVVHVRLQEYPGVETASEGTEPNRYVVIRSAAGG